MAIFSQGSIVGGISGSIGGVTFKAGRGGRVVQARPHKVNQDTQSQSQARRMTEYAAKLWSYQTQTVRDAWDTVAAQLYRSDRLGQRRPWRGRNLFMAQVMYERSNVGLVAYPPPADPRFRTLPVTAGVAVNQVAVSGLVGATGITWDYRAFFFRSWSRAARARRTFLYVAQGQIVGQNSQLVTAQFVARFGSVCAIDEWYGARVVTRHDGCLWTVSEEVIRQRVI